MLNYPNFIIIGAMKCATSTLHEQLALQPGIFMSELKEPNFFSDDDQYIKGMNWYSSHFDKGPAAPLRGESSTHYTKLPTYPNTVQRLQQHLPDAKFIYIMRHPIDRLVSQYVHEWSQRNISVDINRAIEQHPELISYSQYARQLAPYLEAFGSDRVLTVFFERMLCAPQAELERICRFLGYQGTPTWAFDLEAQNVSAARMRTSRWRDAFVDAPLLRTLRRRFVPESFRRWVKSFWLMKNKPILDSNNTDRLRSVFDDDLRTLGAWLGLSLTCDNFKSVVREQIPVWECTTPSRATWALQNDS